ncbi:hypothetical protein OG361_16775 [Streptomyces sp. NBC_00090]|uniref:hypothetical protein n=1 Tax=Streptomyces sp. NBC_00090 TaxID=2903619 RepID=UPI0032525AE3
MTLVDEVFDVPTHRHGSLFITGPDGKVLRISPALPGRTHELNVARAHHNVRICERQRVPISTARTYQGSGPESPPGSKANEVIPAGRESFICGRDAS